MADKRIIDLPRVVATTAGDVLVIDGATSRGITRENFEANVRITGGSITGMLSPALPQDVSNKAYVDAVASGLKLFPEVRLASAAVLPNTPTYANGAAGVGATLTAGSNTTLTVDGTVAALNDSVLVKNQASAFQNGVYTVTTAGSGAAAWVLTRRADFDTTAEMLNGSYFLVTAGATLIGASYTLQATVATVGTDAATFIQFSSTATGVSSIGGASGAITLGTGVSIPGNVLTVEVGAVSVKAFGALCDGVADDTAAIVAAMASLPATGGNVIIPGVCGVSATISVKKPINWLGISAGIGTNSTQLPSSGFKWIGGATGNPIMTWGFIGSSPTAPNENLSGGSLNGIGFDGGGVTDYGLRVADAQFFSFNNTSFRNILYCAVHLTNTATVASPTGFGTFTQTYIDLRRDGMNAANGIISDGQLGTGAAGVTNVVFNKTTITHANGAGVLINNSGDRFTFNSLFTFRAGGETGYGVNYAATGGSVAVGGTLFVNALVNGGYYFAGAESNYPGIALLNADVGELAPGAVLLSGPGLGAVRGFDGTGRQLGTSQLSFVAKNFIPGAAPTVAHTIDVSSSITITIANASNAAMTTINGGLMLVEDLSTGAIGLYMGDIVTGTNLISEAGSIFVATTTTPAAGKASIASNGSTYAIYNNVGSSQTFRVCSIRMR